MDSPYQEKAEENIRAATLCFQNGHYNACVNRSYYGMFQIALALLLKSNFKPTSEKIGHDWVQAEFSRVFIRQQKKFPRFKGFLNLVQEARDIADYSMLKIGRKRAERLLRKAEAFIEAVRQEVRHDA
jgi:uncharacterized protein (UPF0332 family)